MNQVPLDEAATITPSACSEAQRRAAVRRRVWRIVAILFIADMLVDSAPQSWGWLSRPKRAISIVLDRVGLWQGEWSMFAPDPALNNGWFTAEIQHVDGTMTQWNSPYWIEADSGDKFLRFRYLNYFNRLPQRWYLPAREDFADYLARQSSPDVEKIKLHYTSMRLILPDDGTLPKRDEVEWMFSSEVLTRRDYTQHGDLP